MSSLSRASGLLLLLLFTASCGQSGPLYIPGDPSTVQPPADAQQREEEDKDNDSDTRP